MYQDESCVRDPLVLFSVFLRKKVTVNENASFTDYMPGLRIPNCFKLVINSKNENDVTNSDITPLSEFFDIAVISQVQFWSKFHVNIITSPRVMAIFFYKGLTRNLEIGNTPIGVLSNIWRLGQVGSTKSFTNTSNEMLLNAAK